MIHLTLASRATTPAENLFYSHLANPQDIPIILDLLLAITMTLNRTHLRSIRPELTPLPLIQEDITVLRLLRRPEWRCHRLAVGAVTSLLELTSRLGWVGSPVASRATITTVIRTSNSCSSCRPTLPTAVAVVVTSQVQ